MKEPIRQKVVRGLEEISINKNTRYDMNDFSEIVMELYLNNTIHYNIVLEEHEDEFICYPVIRVSLEGVGSIRISFDRGITVRDSIDYEKLVQKIVTYEKKSLLIVRMLSNKKKKQKR